GTRVGDIAAYLHGPGKADEHQYVKDGQRHSGGVVIASTIGAEGATDPAEWAADLRHTQQTRPDITKPIWQTSLRAAPGDRKMDDREWADAASRFMDEMDVGNRPWVAVRHGDDHIHIVLSRVSDDGEVWHGRNDRRAAQRACTVLEKAHGLSQAPRRKVQPKRAVTTQRETWREAAKVSDRDVGNRPWVAVRHGDDHIHIVLSRVSDDGEVWHGRNDRRAAQRACTVLEKAHGLSQAPRRKVQPKRAVTTQRETWREAAKV